MKIARHQKKTDPVCRATFFLSLGKCRWVIRSKRKAWTTTRIHYSSVSRKKKKKKAPSVLIELTSVNRWANTREVHGEDGEDGRKDGQYGWRKELFFVFFLKVRGRQGEWQLVTAMRYALCQPLAKTRRGQTLSE